MCGTSLSAAWISSIRGKRPSDLRGHRSRTDGPLTRGSAVFPSHETGRPQYIPVRDTGSRHGHHPRDIGNAIRQARRNLGLRQDQLAAAANIGVRFVSDLESGKATARLGKILAVIRALGMIISITEPKSRKP